jgi:hypothetical protein
MLCSKPFPLSDTLTNVRTRIQADLSRNFRKSITQRITHESKWCFSAAVRLFYIWLYPLYIVEGTLLNFQDFYVFVENGILYLFLSRLWIAVVDSATCSDSFIRRFYKNSNTRGYANIEWLHRQGIWSSCRTSRPNDVPLTTTGFSFAATNFGFAVHCKLVLLEWVVLP